MKALLIAVVVALLPLCANAQETTYNPQQAYYQGLTVCHDMAQVQTLERALKLNQETALDYLSHKPQDCANIKFWFQPVEDEGQFVRWDGMVIYVMKVHILVCKQISDTQVQCQFIADAYAFSPYRIKDEVI